MVAAGAVDRHDGAVTATARPAGWLDAVAAEVASFDRSSTAERVAGVLRRRITDGDLPPGTRLSEEQLVEVPGVSRNTLREAFRLLAHEGLLVHRLHRGVFVPQLEEADLVDVYRVRRTVECDVVRHLGPDDAGRLAALRDDVAAAATAVERDDWAAVGTSNMYFHQHLVALAGSRRLDETMARLLAELRLAFHGTADPRRLHEPYVARNRALLELLVAGDGERAEGPAVEGALAGHPPPAGPQPARQLERGIVGLGAGVGEQHPGLGAGADEVAEPLGEPDDGLVRGEVAGVPEQGQLAGDGLDDGGVRVAEHVDGDAAHEVEVAAPVDVPDAGALAAGEHDGRGAVVGHERAVPAALPGGGLRAGLRCVHGRTTVPPGAPPAAASSACGVRPSSTLARPTPPRTARRQTWVPTTAQTVQGKHQPLQWNIGRVQR